MLKSALGAIASLAFLASLSVGASADSTSMQGTTAMHTDPTVGGAAMYPQKNIIENALHSPAHTTLVAAVKAAGLVTTLEGPGPFTVFAPTNAAFDQLPSGTVPTLLKPENKAKLVAVLTYHVVAGTLDSAALEAKVAAGHGKAKLTTVQGETLMVTEPTAGHIVLTDRHHRMAEVTTADVYQSNGVIHVINKVLLP